mmetsp:Transcript_59256/g.166194  ORF Transcript_59256/g.166194 Transcript_59256/m.166194 type:complete len:329 (+) Transcript_59256:157-1143(+)
MEDELDNLIADSISGVQTALEGERKASASNSAASGAAAPSGAGASQDWAKEAVRELQEGPAESGDGHGLGEDFFNGVVRTFQDEHFQKAMAEALKGVDPAALAAASSGDAVAPAPAALPPAPAEPTDPAALAGPAPAAPSSAAAPEAGAEEFLSKFMQSFDNSVGGDQNFEKSLGSLMTSMLSVDLICEPLEQISELLEPWLKSQKSLAQSDRSRYEAQLNMYKQIVHIYKSSPDPLPDDAREDVQRLMTELHSLGQPPEDVLRQLAPKDAEDGAQSFEDFMKSMGLDSDLGSAEQDLLKKLSEDPEELTKVMKDMAGGLPEEACKQQ